MQGSICTELIQRLCEYRPHLSRAVAVAAEVDCLIAYASASRQHRYTRPLLTTDNVLHIKQGAHPSVHILALSSCAFLLSPGTLLHVALHRCQQAGCRDSQQRCNIGLMLRVFCHSRCEQLTAVDARDLFAVCSCSHSASWLCDALPQAAICSLRWWWTTTSPTTPT